MADLVISIDRNFDIEKVADELTKMGFTTQTKMGAIGVITGSAPSVTIPALRHVAGVLDLEEDRPVQLNPPGKPQ